MKKLLALAMCFSLILTGCSKGGNEGGSQKPELALVTDSGDINDKSFNQSAWEATTKVGEEKNVGTRYYKPGEFNEAGYVEAIELAVTSGAKAVVLPGFKFETAITKVQDKYPEVKFILVDAVPNGADPSENVYCALFTEQQSGYLAGYAAVKEGFTKLGFMGGIALPAVKNFGFGYVQGAKDAAKEMGTTVTMDYLYTGTFNESPEIKTQASTWYTNGTEVIFSCGGAICNSIFSAAEENGAKAIGVDSDQKDASEAVITSAMKGVYNAVYAQLNAVLDGTFEGGIHTLSAADNAVQLSPDFTRFENFTEDMYKEVFEKVASGEIAIEGGDEAGDPTIYNDETITITYYK